MLKVLLVGHGRFPEGIKNSVEIIMGKQDNLYTINAYTKDTPFEEELNSFIRTVDLDKDKLIIVSDMFGGSVNQKTLSNVDMKKVKLITGLNLSILLEVLMLQEEDVTDEKLRSIVEETRKQIIFVNDTLKEDVEDDFDF
ncbi:PTS sugar transporter subunit IIA [Maledivibacter halophilus]|uniref:PTS system, mannose-specific IIA component n=1 Tax=Maledivibacter halophilus TaxID=36842 RepID=A0A1T5MME8_9FIRM|nr:hypothetical protein [Maledivibacter halophilus]SKC89395.1 PTS system, mannose-specific IIA component [Maledivibacter halophilus]